MARSLLATHAPVTLIDLDEVEQLAPSMERGSSRFDRLSSAPKGTFGLLFALFLKRK